jgi:hypothetical protein
VAYLWRYIGAAATTSNQMVMARCLTRRSQCSWALLRPNLDYFATLAAVAGDKQLADDFAHKYWNGSIASGRVEVLVRKGKVLGKLKGKAEPRPVLILLRELLTESDEDFLRRLNRGDE